MSEKNKMCILHIYIYILLIKIEHNTGETGHVFKNSRFSISDITSFYYTFIIIFDIWLLSISAFLSDKCTNGGQKRIQQQKRCTASRCMYKSRRNGASCRSLCHLTPLVVFLSLSFSLSLSPLFFPVSFSVLRLLDPPQFHQAQTIASLNYIFVRRINDCHCVPFFLLENFVSLSKLRIVIAC